MSGRGLLHVALLVSALLLSGRWLGTPLAAEVRGGGKDTSGVQIRLVGKANTVGQRFVVTGLSRNRLQLLARAAAKSPEAWHAALIVTVASTNGIDSRPMLGEYSVEGEALTFVPRFPLRSGTTYRAEVFIENRNQPAHSRDFTQTASGIQGPAELVAVYPSTNVLPENQLKFYLHFSQAMRRGEAYQRIKLLDQSGKQVEFPFLELGEELWDPSGKRFTLFFDPGRIKRGLQPRELFGAALEEGRSYTLVIDRQWETASGRPLETTHRKKFKVVAPDDRQPAPGDWKFAVPRAESRRPLVIFFGEPLDHAMLQRVLAVSHDGKNVAGRIVITKHESQWSFQPEAAWVQGKYDLVVDAALEDLAGNSIGRPFEVDVFEKIDRKPTDSTVRIPFEIGE